MYQFLIIMPVSTWNYHVYVKNVNGVSTSNTNRPNSYVVYQALELENRTRKTWDSSPR